MEGANTPAYPALPRAALAANFFVVRVGDRQDVRSTALIRGVNALCKLVIEDVDGEQWYAPTMDQVLQWTGDVVADDEFDAPLRMTVHAKARRELAVAEALALAFGSANVPPVMALVAAYEDGTCDAGAAAPVKAAPASAHFDQCVREFAAAGAALRRAAKACRAVDAQLMAAYERDVLDLCDVVWSRRAHWALTTADPAEAARDCTLRRARTE